MHTHRSRRRRLRVILLLLLGPLVGLSNVGLAHAQAEDGTDFFNEPYSRDYEKKMVRRMNEGINKYFARYTRRVIEQRERYWDRDLSSAGAYRDSIRENLERFRTIIGLVDDRLPANMTQEGRIDDHTNPGLVARTPRYTVRRVRWNAVEGVFGEGLLLTPAGEVRARVVALPDAGQTPEQLAGLAEGIEPGSQFARRLAESGVQVLVPALINRKSTWSGTREGVGWQPWRDGSKERPLMTNLPHREWVYRQAYVMGRHVIGVEVQKVLSGIDWFTQRGGQPIGVAGYGEGGLLAFYAAAVDERIDAALVSGYFGPRENLWREPVYRNVWGLLKRFGDAEIGGMIAPRGLVIEHSEAPDVEGPPAKREGERGAAEPGELRTASREAVQGEVERLRGFFEGGAVDADVELVSGDGPKGTVEMGSAGALEGLLGRLGSIELARAGEPVGEEAGHGGPGGGEFDPSRRQKRMLDRLNDRFEKMARLSDLERYRFVRGDMSSVEGWVDSMSEERRYLREELIGKVPQELLPANPRRRRVMDEEGWTADEVVLEVWPGVFAWGLLAMPDDLKEGEKRPVVVVQHGIGGTPTTPIRVDSYHHILPRLVKRGFIVFAPRNPYRFNVRRATAVKASVFSVIIPQHRQIFHWLKTLEHVDDDRIGFYGKSWGGRTALRVPPFVDYSPVVCAAYFNYWPYKVLNRKYRTSYMLEGSIGVYEFDQGRTLGHAEMAGLIAPRPFMVEAGHNDGVSQSEWVGYEFAKVRRLYDLLGIGERAVLGFHAGGHEFHAGTTLPFLHRWLRRPVPATD